MIEVRQGPDVFTEVYCEEIDERVWAINDECTECGSTRHERL